jgi:hypothetical protein
MPVLDARALKTDPEGTAFLLSVLRRNPSAVPKASAKPAPGPAAKAKSADELLQGSATPTTRL